MNSSLQFLPVRAILDYWFGEALESEDALAQQAALWFSGGEEIDKAIEVQFGELFERLADLDAEDFNDSESLLAAVIVLDQFSRNCFRGHAQAFAYDVYALNLLDYALAQKWDVELHALQRGFLYMPLQHIESIDGQRLGVQLFEVLAEQAPESCAGFIRGNAEYAKEHHDIIAEFGRFPHRNQVLGRANTEAEARYLAAGAKRFGQ